MKFKLNFWIFLLVVIAIGAIVYFAFFNGPGVLATKDEQVTGMILAKELTPGGMVVSIVDETHETVPQLKTTDQALFNRLQAFSRYNFVVNNGVLKQATGPI